MMPRLVSSATAPSPPYPADMAAKGWRFELDLERIEQSDTWALAPPDMRPWLLMLWLTAWKQVPCGSLPANDELIAARIGMPARLFAANRDVLLRGWILHDDGRLYHATITEQVLRLMDVRRNDKQRRANWREKQRSLAERVTPVSRVTPPDYGGLQRTPVGWTPPEPEPEPEPEEIPEARGHPARAHAGDPDEPRGASGAPPPDAPPHDDPAPLDGHARTAAGEVCRAVRAVGIANPNPGHPDLLRLLAARVPLADFEALARELVGKRKPRFALLLSTLEGRLHDAAGKGAVPEAGPPWYETRSGIEAKGVELGLGRWDEYAAQRGQGEQWLAYRARVYAKAGLDAQGRAVPC